MGKELGYGDFACFLTTNDSIKTNETQATCKALETDQEYGTISIRLLIVLTPRLLSQPR